MRLRTGSCLLAVGLVLAGCSDEPPPVTLPPLPSASASASALASASPSPTPPALALQPTSAGASAFAEFFLTSIDTAFETADATVISTLSLPGCGGCDALIGSVEGLASAGQKQVGGAYQDVQAVAPGIRDGDVVVDITYKRSAGKIVTGQGQTIRTTKPVPTTVAQARLLLKNDGWKVQGFRVLDS